MRKSNIVDGGGSTYGAAALAKLSAGRIDLAVLNVKMKIEKTNYPPDPDRNRAKTGVLQMKMAAKIKLTSVLK